MRTDRLRLLDAIEQIELVLKFAERGRETFFSDVLVQSAILHRLALLGEAEGHPEIQWPQIIAFRNIVVHQYFGVDLHLVWVIVTKNISVLRTQLQFVVDSLPDTGPVDTLKEQ